MPPTGAGSNPGRLPPSLVVCGPTAAGKTEIALQIARRIPSRLISADSVQVYRGMDIGTAKPNNETLRRFPHALIDIREPEEVYSAAEFAHDAAEEIRAAAAQERLPVVVGGTAMYLRALRYGLDAMPSADGMLRRRIEQAAEVQGWSALHRWLAQLDPESGRRISTNDRQRIQRALEICLASGRPASSFHRGRGRDRLVGSLMLVIAPADRRELHRRIGERAGTMLEAGLVDEVRALVARPALPEGAPALRAVGYRQTIECLKGRIPRDVLSDRIAAATRQLAKRQLTAFRQCAGALWYDPLKPESIDRIIRRTGRLGAKLGHAPDRQESSLHDVVETFTADP